MTLQSNDPARCAEAIVDRVGRDIRARHPDRHRQAGAARQRALPPRRGRPQHPPAHLHRAHRWSRPPYRTSLERRFVEPLLDRLFASYPDLAYAKALRARRLPPNIEVTEFFLQAGAWLGNAHVQQSYTSLNYSHVAAPP